MTPVDLDLLVNLKKELLRTIYANETPQRTHVRVHCPICGDSAKTPNGTHCYVNIEGSKPVSYYCHLCNEYGWVNSTFLRSLNVSNLAIITGVRNYNKIYQKEKQNGTDNWRKKKHDIINATPRSAVPLYKKRVPQEFKLDYIADRIGVGIGYDDISKLKIILSLHDFLDYNSLHLNHAMMRSAQLIENQYVGFLSLDGSYIVCRNTKKDSNPRYINYPIFEKQIETSKSYILPTEVDIMSDDITFNVTEGVMDTLGAFYHVHNRNTTNVIYGAVNGSGFTGFIKKIIHIGFINNININLYSDKDKGIKYHNKLRTISNEYKSLNIWYNHFPGEKDIGVHGDKIDVRKVKMKF